MQQINIRRPAALQWSLNMRTADRVVYWFLPIVTHLREDLIRSGDDFFAEINISNPYSALS
jgi:hypothetical protein